jgi:hypothetical protein
MNVGECEGVNPHTPNWTPTLGIGVPMDSWIFKGRFQRSKLIRLKSYLYHWKDLRTKISKMGSRDPFEYLKHKLWPKEGLEFKLSIWFTTTKSQELPKFICVEVACHILLKSSQLGLQLCFKPHLNRRSEKNLWASKVVTVPISRISPWESQNKMTFECWPHGHTQRIL